MLQASLQGNAPCTEGGLGRVPPPVVHLLVHVHLLERRVEQSRRLRQRPLLLHALLDDACHQVQHVPSGEGGRVLGDEVLDVALGQPVDVLLLHVRHHAHHVVVCQPGLL